MDFTEEQIADEIKKQVLEIEIREMFSDKSKMCELIEQFKKDEETRFRRYQLGAKWIINKGLKKQNERGKPLVNMEEIIAAQQLANLIVLIDEETINNTTADEIFNELCDNLDKTIMPSALVESRGLKQLISKDIENIIDEVLSKNEKAVKEYKEGKTNSINFLIGQAMKLSKGKANSHIAKEMIEKRLT